MGFASDTGYVPSTIDELMEIVRVNVNTQFGTTYVETNFIGTNFYKFFYALIQRLQSNEVKTSEIFASVQQYFNVTNENVLRPNTTHPGIYDYFLSHGYEISTKPPADADAGKLYIAVNVTDNHARGNFTITSYANLVSGTDDSVTVGATVFTAQVGTATLGTTTFQAATSNAATAISLAAQINGHATAGALVYAWAVDTVVYIRALTGGTGGNAIALAYTDNDTNIGLTKSGVFLSGGAEIATDAIEYDLAKPIIGALVKDCCVAGVVSQGTEASIIVLDNGQSFTFKYNLPTKTALKLKLTTVLSENNLFTVLDPLVIKENLLANVEASYKFGKNVEPQRYFSVVDAPWAASVLLEWSSDGGGSYHSTVIDSDYDALYTFALSDITLVET